jgi:hypothetical protein
MTSGPPDQSAAVTERERWESDLAIAFEALLGRRLDDFDPTATYVLYHWDDIMSAEYLECFGGAGRLGSVLRPEHPEYADSGEHPLSWARWSLDLGRSLFFLDADDADSGEGDDRVATTGSVLAAQDPDTAGEVLTVLARVETDGTLFGAMRAATWTMGRPGDPLLQIGTGVRVEETWEKTLERVAPPALRNHLRMLCLTDYSARAEGAFYSGAHRCPIDLRWIAEQPGHTLVAGWEFGEGQASSAVFQVAADARPVAGPGR